MKKNSLSKSEVQILKAIHSIENPTRFSICQAAQLSLIKVSSILNDLENRRFIGKKGKTKTKSGRPSIVYQLNPDFCYSMGVVLELESFRIVGVDGAKNLMFDQTFKIELPADGKLKIEEITVQLCRRLKESGARFIPNQNALVAIGLAVPGMVDTDRGIWLLGLQVGGIKHINIAEIIQAEMGVPVFIEDFARALAFLEKVNGLGKGIRDFILIELSIGMGTGIIINDQLYKGFHGLAGEIGHIAHENNNYRCSCGNVGCLETVISPSGLIKVVNDRLKEGVMSSLQKYIAEGENRLTLEAIFEEARNGDRLALSTLFETGQYLGDACVLLIKLFNPQRIIVSGYGSLFKDFISEPVKQSINRQVLPEMLTDFEIVFSDYKPHHEAYGAGLLALSRYWEKSLTA
ncbi:MAG: ROK family protein [Spirochaetota bacterium]